MKRVYLLRHEDLHGHSGLGTVAEGFIAHSGRVILTWLSEWETETIFKDVKTLKRLHSHEGRTEIIIEGIKKDAKKFEQCKNEAQVKTATQKTIKKHKDQNESD